MKGAWGWHGRVWAGHYRKLLFLFWQSVRGAHCRPWPGLIGRARPQVFDVRNMGGTTLKPLLTLPFPHISGPPTCLSFHPKMPSLLLVGCGRGGVNMVDVARGAAVSTHQVRVRIRRPAGLRQRRRQTAWVCVCGLLCSGTAGMGHSRILSHSQVQILSNHSPYYKTLIRG